MWSNDVETNFTDVCKLLEVCHIAGLIFNSDKFQFAPDVVDFAGLEVTNTGVRPSRKFLDANRAFQRPTNISEVRSFYGMINQVNYGQVHRSNGHPCYRRGLRKPRRLLSRQLRTA